MTNGTASPTFFNCAFCFISFSTYKDCYLLLSNFVKHFFPEKLHTSCLVTGFIHLLLLLLFFGRAEREKVRVSFFQQSKPQEIDLPDETCFIPDADYMMATSIAENNAGHISYNRTER